MAKSESKKTIKKISTEMPKKELKEKKAVKVIKKMRKAPVVAAEATSKAVTEPAVTKKIKSPKYIVVVKVLLVVAVGVVAFLLIQKNRNLILVGTVDKSPIYRWELNQKMLDKYGKTTLEEIVSERILNENLKKNKIVVTDKEVSDELASIKQQYGGEDQFKAAIEQYGMTEAQAKESIRQSVGLKKLIESQNKIEITDEQIKKYFDDNKTTFAGKKLEDVSADIKDTLYNQEIYTKSQDWYTQARQSAKVNSYL